MITRLILLFAVVALAGCANGGFGAPMMDASMSTNSSDTAKKVSTISKAEKEVEARRFACKIGKAAWKLPVTLDPALIQKASLAMGKNQAAALLRPVVSTNFAHTCNCMEDPQAREALKCPKREEIKP